MSRGRMLRMQRQMSKVQYAKLKFDHFNGDGIVTFMNGFENTDWVVRADALQDWIGILTEEYNKVIAEEKNPLILATFGHLRDE